MVNSPCLSAVKMIAYERKETAFFAQIAFLVMLLF